MNSNNIDVRWLQRLSNLKKAYLTLQNAVESGKKLNDLEEQGLIQAFEYTYELAWNTLRDFYLEQGEDNIQGSRDAIQIAFKRGMIEDGEAWLSMLRDRNRSSHTYNQETAKEIVKNIYEVYYGLFSKLITSLEKNKN